MDYYATFLQLPPELNSYVWDLRTKHAEKFAKTPKTPPHVTLREQIGMLENTMNEYLDVVGREINKADIPPLELTITGTEKWDNNYLVFRVRNTPALQRLHEIVMQTSQPFIEGIQPYKLGTRPLTKKQEDNLIRYNSPFVYSDYNPHISIGELKTEVRKPSITIPKTTYHIHDICLVNKTTNKICGNHPLKGISKQLNKTSVAKRA